MLLKTNAAVRRFGLELGKAVSARSCLRKKSRFTSGAGEVRGARNEGSRLECQVRGARGKISLSECQVRYRDDRQGPERRRGG